MLDKLTPKKFEKLTGSPVRLIILDGPSVELTLKEVIAHKPPKDEEERPGDCRSTPFTVVLSGDEDYQAPDGTYSVDFGELGMIDDLFVDNKSDEGSDGERHTTTATPIAAATVENEQPDDNKSKGETAGEDVDAPNQIHYHVVFG